MDDNADFRDALLLLLSVMHFKSQVAASRDDAVKFLRYEQPDLLVVDHYMSGLELKPFLAAISALRDKPKVLLVTAGQNVTPQTFSGQIDGFLRKPILPEALALALQELFKDQ